jgi:hypothetical protein
MNFQSAGVTIMQVERKQPSVRRASCRRIQPMNSLITRLCLSYTFHYTTMQAQRSSCSLLYRSAAHFLGACLCNNAISPTAISSHYVARKLDSGKGGDRSEMPLGTPNYEHVCYFLHLACFGNEIKYITFLE